MADQPLSIILDYLRQHKFSRAEKALLTELQDREEAPSGAADSSDSESSVREDAQGSQNVKLQANGEVFQRRRSEMNTRSSMSDTASRPGIPEVSSMSASYDFSQLHSGFQGITRGQGSASAAGRVQHDVQISMAGSDKARSSNSDPTELRYERSVHHLNNRRTSPVTSPNDDTDDAFDPRKNLLQRKNATEAFCENDAQHFTSGFHEVEDPDADNCADSAYSAPLRNGWLDYCGPDDVAIEALKVSECYSHECEDSLSDVELQHGKQAMKHSGESRKSSGIHLVNESHLPWENVLPNSVEEAEEFLDNQPEELRSVILDKSRYVRNEKGLAKPDHEGYEFDKMFHSDNQVEELRSIILSKSRYAKELGATNGNNAGFDFDKMFHGENQGYPNSVFDHTFNLGSFLEIPIGQGLTLPGDRHGNGGCKISMSQDILEDSPELLSGFATLGDEPSESAIGYPKHYWDSDTYDDEDDPGYHRQPIEDEVWFLAHEIDYPSEDERVISNNEKEPCQAQNDQDASSALNDPQQSYLSGEQIGNATESTGQDMLGHDILNITNLFGKSSLNDVLTLKQIGNMSYDGQLMDAEELKLMGAEPVWQGYSSQKHLNQAEEIQQELDMKDSSPYLSPIVESYSALHQEATAAYANNAANLAAVEEEEATALQEELDQMKLQEDDYEVFTLRIVHRKNRTGFEEEKHFPVVINSVVAGRYLVTEYLGSAAFSKAVQARDLQTGMDVCMKIIKNNKDFFDQSLDEIKLLKFINRHDPSDNHHILRLYDYFYYREHLFLVCELLRANLYEFHKFNRESGGEAYFTMPRLQSIARQCLEALDFLHGLGLIHCDLKPENILIKSYSRCEVKVIDLGSSCFQTDNLCSYVQSRSYRAPEVILGLPYDQKIDIWSLGCILAELCSGVVLFQNDSLATLLARVVGIIGPIMPEMISKGRESHKYFTKNFMLYERNQATSKLEYLVPKKTSLRHRMPTGDQGFVDFVGYLLQINPDNRPSASEALKHPWLTYPYEPILT